MQECDIAVFQLSKEEKWVELDDEDKYVSKFITIATGSSPRLLNIPGEQEYKGDGTIAALEVIHKVSISQNDRSSEEV